MGSKNIGKDKTKESLKWKRSSELITSQDVIFDILLRVPAKSLMRFKTICKQWNSIISNFDFEVLYSRTQIQKLRFLFMTTSGEGTETRQHLRIYKLQKDKREMGNFGRLPIRGAERFIIPVDSSGSLMLFYVNDDYLRAPVYLLFDGNNNNQIILPQLPCDVEFIREQFLLYDPSTNKYKVLVYTADQKDCVSPNSCYITSFRNTTNLVTDNGWRKQFPPFKTSTGQMQHIVIKGILYWFIGAAVIDRENSIHLFDIAEEKFLNIVICPELIQIISDVHKKVYLLDFRGSLGLVLLTQTKFYIWILKDWKSTPWILLHKIHLCSIFNNPIPNHFSLWPIFVLENLKKMPSILFSGYDKTYSYDMNGEKVKEMNAKPLGAYALYFAW